MGGPHYVHGTALGARGHPGHQGDHGERRSSKSELMKAFSTSVARRDPSSNNVYIDLLDLDNEPLLEYHTLYHEIIERHKEGARNRLFIDEVQMCGGFEKAINSIHARGGWDVCLTAARRRSRAPT